MISGNATGIIRSTTYCTWYPLSIKTLYAKRIARALKIEAAIIGISSSVCQRRGRLGSGALELHRQVRHLLLLMSTPDESGDEYGPVVSSWGDQPGANQNTAGGWDSLIDPTFKIQANGIGSGNLHRKGRNFIPVAEEEILRQRNKQPAPKSKKDKENKPAPKRASRKKPSASKPGASKPPVKHNNPPSPAPPKKFGPTPSTTPAFSTLRPPPTGNSVWTSGTLVETPFWEQKDPAVAAPRLQHSNKQVKLLDVITACSNHQLI